MIDLALNNEYDIYTVKGDLALVDKSNQVEQAINIRLLHIAGEWYFNSTTGIDWYDDILSMKTSYEQKISILKDVIMSTPGVMNIESFIFGVDQTIRTAIVTYTVRTSDGTVSSGIGI